MAYRTRARRSVSRRVSTRRPARRVATRTARRRSTVRSGSRRMAGQTVRIVIEQPGSNPLARPDAIRALYKEARAKVAPKGPKF